MIRRVGVVALAAVLLGAGAGSLFRSGYSPDEEFTLFAARGIQAHGLPLLPSGLLYDRGLAYSYLCWLGGILSGVELPAYRFVSLASAAVALVLVFCTVRRLTTTRAAGMAALLVATSVPFWAVATSGRFYAPFLASYVGVLALLARVHRPPSDASAPPHPGTPAPPYLSTLLALGAVAALCRLTHELAFTLALVPVCCWLLCPRTERRVWLGAAVAVTAGLAAAQAGLLGLHFAVPQSGDTMIQRFFVWQVLNLFESPPPLQIGVPLIAMTVAWALAPRRAGLIFVVSLCGVAMVLGAALTRAVMAAGLWPAVIESALVESARYPLDMFWHLARTNPLLLASGLVLMVSRLAGLAGPWSPGERAAHVAWIGWVAWFGVIESGITVNYLLLPVTFVLVAVAVDVDAHVRHRFRGRRAGLAFVAVGLFVAAVVADSWRGNGPAGARLAAVRPTIDVPGIEAVRASLAPADRVACTDELACLLLVGRVDAWLALDDYVRERFVVLRGGAPAGVYTGAPARMRPADLFEPEHGAAPSRVVVVDVFKEYPVGSSRNWLPRAVEADHLEWRTLLETQQVRIIELSRPARNARWSPLALRGPTHLVIALGVAWQRD